MTASLAFDRTSRAADGMGLTFSPPVSWDGVGDAAALTQVTFSVASTRAAFDALEPEWNALFASAGRGAQVFQQFNWLWHWANHFLDQDSPDGGQRLAIVTGRVAGRLVLVWPLVVSETRFVRRLSWMGEPASQYGDVLFDPSFAGPGGDSNVPALLRASWCYLVDTVKPDVVHLRKVRADSAISPLLAELGPLSSGEAEAPFLALSDAPTFDAYEERYTAKARKNRRRLMRRLSERAGIEIETHREGPQARALADLAVSLKRAWLRDRGQISPALADDRIGRFLADACDGRGRPTGARVSVMRSGGEPASIEVGFVAKGTLALHIIVYSLKFEKTGAGVLHLEDGIRRSFADGVTTLDLLAPRADYKMDWADGVIQVADHSVPLTASGRLYAHVYLRFARTHVKALAQRLPMAMRRALG